MESLLPDKGGKLDIEPQAHKPGHPKSCRYGRNCMRPDCKFWHEGRPNINSPTLTREHSKRRHIYLKLLLDT